MDTHWIRRWLRERGMDFVHLVDLSPLPQAQTCGYTRAILFGVPLTAGFVRDFYHGRPTADEYLQKEEQVEALADLLAKTLAAAGIPAISQSEAGNLSRGLEEGGYIDPALRCGPSAVPQKTLGRLAGMGFIGRNNLLVTRVYGCALAMCSVLLREPLPVITPPPAQNGCGSCHACVDACPTGALLGRDWHQAGGRSQLFDRAKCACPLRCMVVCPYTLRYAGELLPHHPF